ncbi:MAG: hypothetical protein S4CHLAM45_00910 [Chlamydiales bacterium]|nr:hypothetical protein [Chlamydiales bacterium]MCH9619412.1 hypothetical protein [Chlamydiales bacterium]MCH9622216.1 hypothetical protein [Chlamydiales bacterium]
MIVKNAVPAKIVVRRPARELIPGIAPRLAKTPTTMVAAKRVVATQAAICPPLIPVGSFSDTGGVGDAVGDPCSDPGSEGDIAPDPGADVPSWGAGCAGNAAPDPGAGNPCSDAGRAGDVASGPGADVPSWGAGCAGDVVPDPSLPDGSSLDSGSCPGD